MTKRMTKRMTKGQYRKVCRIMAGNYRVMAHYVSEMMAEQGYPSTGYNYELTMESWWNEESQLRDALKFVNISRIEECLFYDWWMRDYYHDEDDEDDEDE